MSDDKKIRRAKHLSDDEHILLRPNIFMGSVSNETFKLNLCGEDKSVKYTPGLFKMVNEIIDNSVDVAIYNNFKYANKIDINIDKHSVTVKDNGTGIPVEQTVDKDGNDIWEPVLVWTYTKAGGNFEDDEEGRSTMGMNGVGSTIVSIFSKLFVGETVDGKHKCIVTTKDNNKLDNVKVTKNSGKTYTQVYFEPDFQRLDCTEFDDDFLLLVKDRVMKLAACFPEITFSLNGEKIRFKTLREFFNIYSENNEIQTNDNVGIMVTTSESEKFESISAVNGLDIRNGGSHIEYFNEMLVKYLRPLINKKYKFDVLPTQIIQHIKMVTICKNFKNLKFDSQTKEFITNSRNENVANVGEFDFEKFANRIIKNESIITPIIEYQLLKQEQAKKRKLAAEQKKMANANVPKHVKPQSKDNTKNVLYIVEGDSAKGNFIQVRNKQHHGIFPLRGKIINVIKYKPIDIIKNEECNSLMNILGLEYGKKAPDVLPYSEIYIAADADVDGYSITTQAISFFNLWPELYDRGIIKIIRTPIMEILKNGKLVKTIYSLDEYAQYKLKSGEKIKYLKGLGSMSPDLYKKYLIEFPRVEKVVRDEHAQQKLLDIFSDDSAPRKKWLLEP